MKEDQKQQILEEYASNIMAKLRKISYPLFIKFGGLSEKDHDNFYSKANMELWKATEVFDNSKGIPFEAYLLGCLKRKFKTEMTGLNREKRKADRLASSLDAPVGEDEGTTIGDTLTSDYSVENDALDIVCTLRDESTQNYLNSLSPKQEQIAELIMNEYESSEIKDKLGLSDKQYNNYLKDMRTFEKTIVLKQADYVKFEEDKPMSENTQNTQTLEKSKSDRLSIASINKENR